MLVKRLYLEWKRKQLILKIEKLTIQMHHSPHLIMELYDLDLKLKSLNDYLGY